MNGQGQWQGFFDCVCVCVFFLERTYFRSGSAASSINFGGLEKNPSTFEIGFPQPKLHSAVPQQLRS